MQTKRGLGRGLGELLSEMKQFPDADVVASPSPSSSSLQQLSIDLMQPGIYQPRRDFDHEALSELAASIRAQGILQPIIVRPISMKGHYEIIAGERRWRAAQMAGLHEVPVIIREISDEAAIAMALIENIQRENLNAIEEAIALHRLIEEFDMTHEEVAKAVGKSRTTVTNLLRLLMLNEDVRMMLQHGDLEMGHARALLGLEGTKQSQAARMVAEKNMSVRDTEQLVKRLQNPSEKTYKDQTIDPNVQALQKTLSDKFAAPVLIQYNSKGKGRLIIHFNSIDEFDGILQHLQ